MNSIFEVGKYYVVGDDDEILAEADNIKDAVLYAEADNIILCCMDCMGSRVPKPTINNVIIDFEKNELTIDGVSANILGKCFKEGTSKIKKAEGLSLLRELRDLCSNVSVVGEPFIDAEDITNEMSDL